MQSRRIFKLMHRAPLLWFRVVIAKFIKKNNLKVSSAVKSDFESYAIKSERQIHQHQLSDNQLHICHLQLSIICIRLMFRIQNLNFGLTTKKTHAAKKKLQCRWHHQTTQQSELCNEVKDTNRQPLSEPAEQVKHSSNIHQSLLMQQECSLMEFASKLCIFNYKQTEAR